MRLRTRHERKFKISLLTFFLLDPRMQIYNIDMHS